MGASESPFKPLPAPDAQDDLLALIAAPRSIPTSPPPSPNSPVTARLHGFDLQDSALLTGLPHFPAEVVAARSTVALRRAMVGRTVLVLHECGDWTRPIIVGVLQEALAPDPAPHVAPVLDVQEDGERLTLQAEREIVLRCGDACITLTRAGKVIIKGNYILSRSAGYNRIKGAAVDIN